MTKLQTLLISTAIGAFAAFPALAQVTSDTTDISATVGVTAVADGTSNLGTGAGETITPVSEAFLNTPVMTADGQMLGTVTSAASMEDGTTAILIDVDQEVGARADNVQILLAAGEVSDGQIELIWSKADILGALEAQADSANDDSN